MQGERETKLNIFGEPGENPIYNSILHQGTVFKIIPKFKFGLNDPLHPKFILDKRNFFL
jgi:hypothetical protein